MSKSKKTQKIEIKKTFNRIIKAVQSFIKSLPARIASPFKKLWTRNKLFRKRRPHKTFRKTERIKANKTLNLPGYFSFASSAWAIIWKNKRFFFKFFLLFCVFAALILGALNQDLYVKYRDSLNSSEEAGSTQLGFVKYFTLAASAITSQSGSTISEGQQIISVVMFLFGWLMIVWGLRQILAGNKPKLRDALYSSGGPFLSTLFVIAAGLLQLIPLALSLLAYQALTGVGIINNTIAIENMAFWVAEAVIVAMTLYWLTSTFLALVIVTLPGMYPGSALTAAGDIITGRRLKFLYRILFMIWPILILWLVVLVPIVILDSAIQITWLPLVPFAVLLLTTMTLMWCVTYIYLLYRKTVEDDAKTIAK